MLSVELVSLRLHIKWMLLTRNCYISCGCQALWGTPPISHIKAFFFTSCIKALIQFVDLDLHKAVFFLRGSRMKSDKVPLVLFLRSFGSEEHV